jgi:uncharacterized protein (DUF1015 family)
VADPGVAAAVEAGMRGRELLIADGHHRYETARAYAEEVGGEGDHRYVLMNVVALQDPGLTVFPTHRLLSGLDGDRRGALRDAVARDWEAEDVAPEALEPTGEDGGRIAIGYLDAERRQPLRLTLRDQGIADAALPGMPGPYRRLDTAVLEALVLKGALGMSEDDISHLHGLEYARSTDQAREAVLGGKAQAAFFMRGTPVDLVRDVAATGESMPPKSTYFFPKVPTGLLFNPLA